MWRWTLLALTIMSLVEIAMTARNCGVPRNIGEKISPVDPTRERRWGATYVCDDGYKIKGQPDINKNSAFVRCKRRGRWQTRRLPVCEAIQDCGQIPDGVNTVSVSGVVLNYPSFHVYSCLNGYVSNTSMVIVCQADGKLTMTTGPTCDPVECPYPGAGTNVDSVLTDESPYLAGTVVRYTCPTADTVTTCAQKTLVCLPDGTWSRSATTCDGGEEGGET